VHRFLVLIGPRLPDLEPLDSAPVLNEGYFEKHIRILEESLLETNNDELAGLEVLANHKADVLGV
jgi:hypothetical protein